MTMLRVRAVVAMVTPVRGKGRGGTHRYQKGGEQDFLHGMNVAPGGERLPSRSLLFWCIEGEGALRPFQMAFEIRKSNGTFAGVGLPETQCCARQLERQLRVAD